MDGQMEGRKAGWLSFAGLLIFILVYAFLTFSANFLFGFFCMNEALQSLYSYPQEHSKYCYRQGQPWDSVIFVSPQNLTTHKTRNLSK